MENPIDHTIDLGFVNYVQHPTNPSYIVYRFADKNRADSFEKGMKERGIWFEKESEDKRGKKYYLFGIHKNDYKKTEQLNYLVEAEHKKPFIPFRIFRYSILLISAIAMILASIGYCKHQNKLKSLDNPTHSINSQY